ncbi:porin [Hydrogenophaga sp.]|uniref:porin n=1 Tax=Hydrogenophaga sp. TaxID=1904254 RepID=UPI0027320BA4|nr:porin [Hydrogenophaga sp.]MDP2017745.1 porin [Hydrogenophaga sp.]MDP3165383.1 porin [Hydrogenophaga sp.]MDP3811850.1 porin [Hydrogenophaga sp.]
MKKSLIALAVLASAGAAQAQSTVTLYGLADIWVGSTKATATVGGVSSSARTTRIDGAGFNTSRFGLKGSEDLGGGLKANFQLEQGYNSDTGTVGATGFAFNRQAWVGLSGGFGEVQLGRVWTSYDDIRSSANDTFNANIASSFSTWVGYNDRTNNGIKYLTPSFGGLSGSVTYALGEDKNTSTNGKDNNLLSVGAQYAAGPVFVGFAHQTEKSGTTTKLGALGTLGAVPDGTKVTYNLLNGSYDLGVVKLLAGFNQVKGTEPTTPGFLKASEYFFGVEAPLSSALSVAGGVSQSKIKDDTGPQTKGTGFSVALKYNLSKRTFTYAALNQTKFKDDTGATLDSAKTQLFAVGLQHAF